MRTRNFLRSCYHGLVGRAPAYLLGAVFTAGLAFSLTSYAVHDLGVFELDNGTTGANAIDQSDIHDADAGDGLINPDDWAQNNFPDTFICPDGLHSCGYVSGPNVLGDNPGGSAFRSLFIQDPNGDGNNDDIYTQGSKDDLDARTWVHTLGSVPDKDNLLPVGAAAYLHGIDKELLVYLFGTLSAPNGDANLGAWLFKKNIGKCANGKFGVVDKDDICLTTQPINLHSIGDVFIVAANTLGGRKVAIQIYKWVDEDEVVNNKFVDTEAAGIEKGKCKAPQGSPKGTLPILVNSNLCLVFDKAEATCDGALTGDIACGTMNIGAVKQGDADFPTESPDDWGYTSKFPPSAGPANPPGTDGIGADDFPGTTLFEAGVNISELIPGAGCFSSFLMNTRASASVDAALKDLAAGKFPLCGISVEKTGDTLGKIGDPADYTITVTNTGAITLTRESIDDTLLGDLADPANPYVTSSTCDATLDADASCVITATRTVLVNDPDPLPNTVTVVYSAGEDESTDSASHSVNLFQPDVSVVKTGDTLGKIGDPVDYTIVVTNDSSDGNPDLVNGPTVPDLVNGSIVDTLLGDLLAANSFVTSSDCTATLATGASCTINATRTVQEGDPDPLPNTVTVLYNPEGFDNPITANDDHSVNLFQPAVSVVKTGDTLSKVGDPVDYTIVVTNDSSDGNPDLVNGTTVPHLVNGTIVDTLLGDLLAANSFVTSSDCTATLATGASCTINATRTVQEGDPDPLPNTVTVLYNPQGFTNPITANDDHSVNLFDPSVVIDKRASCVDENDQPIGVVVGENITYTYIITNTSTSGSISPAEIPALNLFSIVDDKLGSLAADAALAGCDELAAGASCNFTKVVSTSGFPPLVPVVNTVNVTYNPAGFPNEVLASDVQSCDIIPPEPARVVIEKELLNGEGLLFDYIDFNLTETGAPGVFTLTPLFALVGTQHAQSPFLAVDGVVNSFATTEVKVVEIPDITQTVQSSVTEDLPLPAFVDFVGLECAAATDGGSLTNSDVLDRTATLTLGSGDFAFCRYTNRFTPPGEEGCTPGFWKNHLDHWALTGYDPDQRLDSVFDFSGVNGGPNGVISLADDSLLDALNYGGGNGKLGAAQILLRAAVAALLNASHPDVDFPISKDDVILQVNTALSTNNRDEMLKVATALDNANNGVLLDNGGTADCPLSGGNTNSTN